MLSQTDRERIIIEWINRGLSKKGKTSTGLAEAMGVAQPRISEIIVRKRGVRATELPDIARYLEEPVPPELTEVFDRPGKVKLHGVVQAGYWAEPNEDRVTGDEWFDVPMPEVLHTLRKFALRVEGNSMNLVYPAGTLLICASVYDLHEDDPIAGKRYIVERRKADGRVETTVKEVQLDAQGKWWLWPRSNEPQHQEPIPYDAVEGDEVAVTARVLFSVRPE